MGFFRRFRTLAEDRRRRLEGNGRDKGATAVEYGLILALFAIGMVGVSGVLFRTVQTQMGVQSTNVGNTVAIAVTPPATITGTPTCNAGGTWDGTACVAICPTTQWFNAGTGACDPIPVCATNEIYNGTTNTCITQTATPTATATPTPTGTPTVPAPVCNVGGWYNPVTNNCDPQPTCSGATPVYNPFTNTCQSGALTGPQTTCLNNGGAWVSGSCVANQAACNALGNAWLQGQSGTASSCISPATCNAGGSAFMTSPVNRCVTQGQCTVTVNGVWTPGSPPTCQSSAACLATAGNTWDTSKTPPCRTPAMQCTDLNASNVYNASWAAPQCRTPQQACELAANGSPSGSTYNASWGSPQCRTVAQQCTLAADGSTNGNAYNAGWAAPQCRTPAQQCTLLANGSPSGSTYNASWGSPQCRTVAQQCELAANGSANGNLYDASKNPACRTPAQQCTDADPANVWNASLTPSCRTPQLQCTDAGNVWVSGTCYTPQQACTINGNAWDTNTNPDSCRTPAQCRASNRAVLDQSGALTCVNQTQCQSAGRVWGGSTNNRTCLLPYTGPTPNSSYPNVNRPAGSGTYDLVAQLGLPAGVSLDSASCSNQSNSGCSRSSFNNGTDSIVFTSQWAGNSQATWTVSWSIPATSTTAGASGTFTIRFT